MKDSQNVGPVNKVTRGFVVGKGEEVKVKIGGSKMKKIGIAVFALMFVGVSYVGAQNIRVSFDQGILKTEFNKVVVPTVVPAKVETLFYRLDKVGIQEFQKEILDMKGVSEKFRDLIADNKTVVLYNNTGLVLITFTVQDNYSVLWESNKQLISFLMNMKFKNKKQLSYTKTRIPGDQFTGGGPINERDVLEFVPDGGHSGGCGGGGGRYGEMLWDNNLLH
ncbi:MAG: hypothetical protein KAR84_05355 [Elusimicrobiales bacterium]|nr:hypothetical protein [Elusimicrobiales bacterium]